MKMNKIIIPVAALAMGVALVGSVSSTLAWYQYSTKAQAAFIGTSVGESENLEIKTANGQWKSSLSADDVNGLISNYASLNVLPITTSGLAKNVALPAKFYNSVETGVAGVDTYGDRYADATNYVKFDLYVRYRKTSYSAQTPNSYLTKKINLVDLTIVDNAGPKANENDQEGQVKDLYKAVRVHFASDNSTANGAFNKLFARDSLTNIEATNENGALAEVSTDTYGQLDTDNDGKLDSELVYSWQTAGEAITYGAANTKQIAYNAAYGKLEEQVGTVNGNDETGLKITVTIWLEGWQKLSGKPAGNYDNGDANADPARAATDSAIWDPAVYINKKFKIGMRFQAVDA